MAPESNGCAEPDPEPEAHGSNKPDPNRDADPNSDTHAIPGTQSGCDADSDAHSNSE
jgi:hypothetical protein